MSKSRKLFPKKSTKNSMSVFHRLFFVLSRFRVFLSDGSASKTLLKKRFAKEIVSKRFYQKFTKNPKPIFFSIFFNHVFGRFSVGRSSKTR
jgi:hypothetical protein